MPFHLKMTGVSYTADARVKVPSFQTLPAAKSLKFSFLHAVYIGSPHCSVHFIIGDTALKFLLLDLTILVSKVKKIMQSTSKLTF